MQWEKQKKVELQSSRTSSWVPAKELAVGGYEFRFLTNPLEVWKEGQAMRHCAFNLVRACETGVCLLVSIKRESARVATLKLRQSGGERRVHHLAGKANRLCNGAISSASSVLWVLLEADPGELLRG